MLASIDFGATFPANSWILILDLSFTVVCISIAKFHLQAVRHWAAEGLFRHPGKATSRNRQVLGHDGADVRL
jgi:hypothetical protein